MQLDFASSKLRQAFTSRDAAISRYGEAIGKKYVKAVQLIKQANTVDDLYAIPQLRFHALQGNRKGEFAAKLTGNWRVVLTFPDDATARIEKVEDYHGR